MQIRLCCQDQDLHNFQDQDQGKTLFHDQDQDQDFSRISVSKSQITHSVCDSVNINNNTKINKRIYTLYIIS